MLEELEGQAHPVKVGSLEHQDRTEVQDSQEVQVLKELPDLLETLVA